MTVSHAVRSWLPPRCPYTLIVAAKRLWQRSALTAILWGSLIAFPAHGTEPASDELLASLSFRPVPAGTYRRGFDTEDRGEHRFALQHQYSNSQNFSLETPAHLVQISRPFQITATEVTVAQFRAFVAATEYVTDAERNGGALGCFPLEKDYTNRFHKDPAITWRNPGFEQTDRHPVVAVSWNDANAYCRWLSQTIGQPCRLPTEAEWEYACKATTSTWYHWGEDPQQAIRFANVADATLEAAQPGTTRFQQAFIRGAEHSDGAVFTAPVASYEANSWGLHDMHGNVWEWCHDRWKSDLYKDLLADVERRDRREFTVTDPLFETATDQHQYGDWRVIRGGGWTCAAAAVRSSIRTFAEASDSTVYTGFRVVIAAE